LKCIIFNTSQFLANKNGYPVLPRSHQKFLTDSVKMNVPVVISGCNRHREFLHYQQYVGYLAERIAASELVSQYANGFEDFLQCPLQPLMDNLDSQTYEVFEKDPVKYTEYQRAIHKAIMHKQEKNLPSLVIMVMGAGRGPIVTAALAAAEMAGVQVMVYAVEKNPNAIVTLTMKMQEEWKDKVKVIACDMRKWDCPDKADILVSELLGSFGDNELSPECLDGAQRFLKDDGICIPKEYTSYLCPVQSQKLFSEVRAGRDRGKNIYENFEQVYVVHQLNVFRIAQAQPLFKYSHPNNDPVIDNDRFGTLTFEIQQDSVLHGFSGYFETILYDDIKLSIVPETFTRSLCSWFPVFIPIREPQHLKAGEKLEACFWRLSSPKGVWYEWSVRKPMSLPLHNPNGRSYIIGLE